MLVWLASWPRSGNTFFRATAHARHGLPTTSTYEVDGPAVRVGPELLGASPRPASWSVLVDDPRTWLVHTHERPGADAWPAIVLVRDGRDALVSRAHQLVANGQQASFVGAVAWLLDRPFTASNPSSGSWGANVLAWLDRAPAPAPAPAPVPVPVAVVRFEELVARPEEVVDGALGLVGGGGALGRIVGAPAFADLHRRAPEFFRRGVVGSHRDELPDELHDRFWSVAENAAAMRRLGYD